jgi:sugar (pentulose or hexulose) kinase
MVGGVSSTTGSSLVWAYDKLCRGKEFGQTFEEVVALALEIDPGAEGLSFLPYLAGERNPHWSDTIRGGFYGLQLTHDYRHMFRAVMEGVAYSLRHLLDICEELQVPIDEIALAGGGATTPGFPQIVADVCERDVLMYAGEETVTRVLYALCREHLGREHFDVSLLQTFDKPGIVSHSRAVANVYRAGYRRYRAFVRFASDQGDAAAREQAQGPPW